MMWIFFLILGGVLLFIHQVKNRVEANIINALLAWGFMGCFISAGVWMGIIVNR